MRHQPVPFRRMYSHGKEVVIMLVHQCILKIYLVFATAKIKLRKVRFWNSCVKMVLPNVLKQMFFHQVRKTRKWIKYCFALRIKGGIALDERYSVFHLEINSMKGIGPAPISWDSWKLQTNYHDDDYQVESIKTSYVNFI